jgi:hypothetical protein
VDVILDDNDDYVTLTIRDNGIGLSIGRINNSTTHGLRGMRERASYLGGRIDISSEPARGTKITVTLPKTLPVRSPAEQTGYIQHQPKLTLLKNTHSKPHHDSHAESAKGIRITGLGTE